MRESPTHPPPGDWTVDELMAAVLASCLHDGDQVMNGVASHLPVCAIELARRTHAPDLVWLAGAQGVEPRAPRLGESTADWPLWRESVMWVDVVGELWDWAADDRLLRTFFVGAAQVDAHGNANNSVIGDFHRPRVRLPGTAGLGDLGALPTRLVYYVPSHSRRTVVERVDFRSGAGYLDGHGERERLGLRGGPELVVTDLAVLDFEPGSQRMRLRSVHPGVGVDDVLAATGFTPVVPDAVAVTSAPTAEQVRLLREEIDPLRYRARGVTPPSRH